MSVKLITIKEEVLFYMGKFGNSPRYRVEKKPIKNVSPPPEEIIKYVVFDRRASVEIGAYFDSYDDAQRECMRLNELSPGYN